NPAGLGGAVTISATVTPPFSGGFAPTGTVSFFLNGAVTPFATQTIPAGNPPGPVTVQTTTSSLPQGPDVLTAFFSGDSNYNSATSAPVTETVTGGALTKTTLASNPTNPVTGQPITLNATVAFFGSGTPPATPPTGTVTFKEGSTVLATVP